MLTLMSSFFKWGRGVRKWRRRFVQIVRRKKRGYILIKGLIVVMIYAINVLRRWLTSADKGVGK